MLLSRSLATLLVAFAVILPNVSAAKPMVAAGATHTLFLLENGTVQAVGANASGQLGSGTVTGPTSSPVPVLLPNATITPAVMVAAGGTHSLALLVDGTVWAWGANDVGQLGNGTTDATTHPNPAQVPGLVNIVSIAAGENHSVALASDGTIYVWGANDQQQSGGPCGGGANTPAPTHMLASCGGSALSGVTAIAAGRDFNLALLNDAHVIAWGDNTYGQLGHGTTGGNSAVPLQVLLMSTGQPIANASRIAAGANHGLALEHDNDANVDTHVLAWGRNNAGQLGDGTTTDRNQADEVLVVAGGPAGTGAIKGITQVAAGRQHSILIGAPDGSGRVVTFGNNASGQLGRSGSALIAQPTLSPVSATAAFSGSRADRSFVYVPNGGDFGHFEAMGDDANGELGLGSAGAPVTSPAIVTAVTSVGQKSGKHTNFRNTASRSDLLWRNTNTNAVTTWDYTTAAPAGFSAASLPAAPATWHVLATADVNGDGKSDVVWQDSAGVVHVWLMNDPGSILLTYDLPAIAAPWQFVSAGDFDGDGRWDLLWRNTTTGEVLIWYMGIGGDLERAQVIATLPPSEGWQIATTADVNGDGIHDLIWFRASDGQVAIWRMAANGTFVALFPAAVGPNSPWRIYKAGDFDGDGREDIFWRNQTDGTNCVWYFQGGRGIASFDFYVGTQLSQWRLDASGDFDGDGRDDLMWFNLADGSTVRWIMQGRGTSPVFQPVIGVGAGWQAFQ